MLQNKIISSFSSFLIFEKQAVNVLSLCSAMKFYTAKFHSDSRKIKVVTNSRTHPTGKTCG